MKKRKGEKIVCLSAEVKVVVSVGVNFSSGKVGD